MADDFASVSDLQIAIDLLVKTKLGVQELKTLQAALDSTAVSANKTKAAVASVGNSTDNGLMKLSETTKVTANSFDKLDSSVAKSGKSLFSLTNIARTALGTLEAMAIFFISKFVGEALSKVIDSVSQLEQSFYKLSIAEKAISNAGIDITPKELVDIANSVAHTYETVSKIDALKMIGNLTVLTKDLKLTAEEYKKLAMAIPLVAQQAQVSIDETTGQIVNGITKNGRGLADLGITVNEAILREGAVKDGLVATAAAYDALDAEQKQAIKTRELINVIDRSTNENLKEQPKYLESIQGKQGEINKLWETFATTLGVEAGPLIKLVLNATITGLKGIIIVLKMLEYDYVTYGSIVLGVYYAENEAIKGNIHSLAEYQAALTRGIQGAKQLLGSQFVDKLPKDTATGIPEAPTNQHPEDIAGATKKFNDEILQAQIKFSQDMQDVEIDLGRKMVDITAEYAKKRADAEKEYINKVSDINASYQNKLDSIKQDEANASQKARDDELKREKAFQEKMQELRERFLMDLDDALHARDARQILRLIKNYNLEKLQAERQHTLDNQNAQLDSKRQQEKFAQERADAEKERRAKLAEAQRDYNDKVAKLKADEDAEVQAAVLAANRRIQDLEKNNADRLAIIASNLISEYNLTAQGLQAIASLYHKYYADVSAVYFAMQAMMGASGLGTASAKVGGNGMGTTGVSVGTSTQPSNSLNKRFAEGGSMIANQPTSVTFGEGGLEMATFTPIGRNGKDVNKMFSNLGGGGNSENGAISIELLLSPDLESRIVKNTLGKTAEIFTRIQRSKN